MFRSAHHINGAACSKRCSPSKNHSPARGLDGREDRFVDHIRHRFDLGRCYEARVPLRCSVHVPHGLRDPCSHRSVLHRGERLGSSSRSIRAIGTPWGSGGGLEEAFSDFLGHHADLLEEHRKSVYWYLVPFIFGIKGDNRLRGRAHLLSRSTQHAALAYG